MYESYKNNGKVAIYLVYLREVHPSEQNVGDSPAQVRRRHTGHDIAQHKTLEDRIAAASQCLEGLELTLPTLIDGMDNAAHTAYGVRAAALAIIDLDGKLAFYDTKPSAVQPEKADKVIQKLLASERGSEESEKQSKPKKTRVRPEAREPATP